MNAVRTVDAGVSAAAATRRPGHAPFRRRAALVLLLLLTACGGSAPDSAATATATAATAGATTSAPDATPSEATPTSSAATATAAPRTDGQLTPVRLAFVPATTGLLVNIAAEQGFYEDNGLDVELMPAPNISEIIPALGRQFDISLGTATDLIRAADSGLDVVQILGNTIDTEDNPFVQLVTTPDSGISGVADLSGRSVGSPTLSGVIHVATLFWAQQEGVDPSTINGVQVPPPNLPDQLNAGQVDAVEALEPFASQLLADGNVSLGDPFAAIGLPLATNFWIANGRWTADNPEVVDAFAASLEQALAFLEQDEAGARVVLEGYTGLPPQVASRVPLPRFDLEVREQDLATWIDVLRALGEFDGELQPADLVR